MICCQEKRSLQKMAGVIGKLVLFFMSMISAASAADAKTWTGPSVVPKRVVLGEPVDLVYHASGSLQDQHVRFSQLAQGEACFFSMYVKQALSSGIEAVGWGSRDEVDPRFTEFWEGATFTFRISAVDVTDLGIYLAELRHPEETNRVLSRQNVLLYTEGAITVPPPISEGVIEPGYVAVKGSDSPGQSPPPPCPPSRCVDDPETLERTTVILIAVIAILVTAVITVGIVILCLYYMCGLKVTVRRLPGERRTMRSFRRDYKRPTVDVRRSETGDGKGDGVEYYDDDVDGHVVEMTKLKKKTSGSDDGAAGNGTAPRQCTDLHDDVADTSQTALLQHERARKVCNEPHIEKGAAVKPEILGKQKVSETGSAPPTVVSAAVPVETRDEEQESACVQPLITKVLQGFQDVNNAPVTPQSAHSVYYSAAAPLDRELPLLASPQPRFVSNNLDVPESTLGVIARRKFTAATVAKISDRLDQRVVKMADTFSHYREEVPEANVDRFVEDFLARSKFDASVKDDVVRCVSLGEDPAQIVQFPANLDRCSTFSGRYAILSSQRFGARTYLVCVENHVRYNLQQTPRLFLSLEGVTEDDIEEFILYRAFEGFKQKGLLSTIKTT